MRWITLVVSTCLLFSSLSSTVWGQRVKFSLIPDASSANDMSPDGRYVVGRTLGGENYLWDTVSGVFTTLPAGGGNATAVSDDGQTVLSADMENPETPGSSMGSVAGLWKASTGSWQSLGYLPNALNCPSKSDGYELSADGTIAVGLSWDGCSGRGFRWTQATGMVELESLANGSNRASVISADGQVIAGFAQGSFSRTPAVWDGTTLNGELLDPPDGDALGEISGIRDDGSVLLGEWIAQDDPSGASRATMWTDDGAGNWIRQQIGNGSFRPGWGGNPLDIADDGTIVGFDILPGSGIRRGWIQPPSGAAMQELNSLVLAGGGELPIVNNSRLILEVPQAISIDGRTIIGHGSPLLGAGFGNVWRIQITSNCDLDFDNQCDVEDIDLLVAAIATGATESLYDLNGDGDIDLEDRDQWLLDAGAENLTTGSPYLVGDANLDGSVDLSDFHQWNANKFSATGIWSLADFNADGTTNEADFDLWNSNKFTSSGSLTAVPEPGLLALTPVLFLAGAMIAARRRRQ